MLMEILSGIPSDAKAELLMLGLLLLCVGAAVYVWRVGRSE
jgi:predicted membrane channel-forming protein YqfA (hemolysin III family)